MLDAGGDRVLYLSFIAGGDRVLYLSLIACCLELKLALSRLIGVNLVFKLLPTLAVNELLRTCKLGLLATISYAALVSEIVGCKNLGWFFSSSTLCSLSLTSLCCCSYGLETPSPSFRGKGPTEKGLTEMVWSPPVATNFCCCINDVCICCC